MPIARQEGRERWPHSGLISAGTGGTSTPVSCLLTNPRLTNDEGACRLTNEIASIIQAPCCGATVCRTHLRWTQSVFLF